jgi:hypothetical protein
MKPILALVLILVAAPVFADDRPFAIAVHGGAHAEASTTPAPFERADGLTLTALLTVSGGLAIADHLETFVSSDPAAAEFPEGAAVDKRGNVYASLTLRDEIRRIAPDGTQTVHVDFEPSTGPVGLAVDSAGTLYVAASGLIWRRCRPIRSSAGGMSRSAASVRRRSTSSIAGCTTLRTRSRFVGKW